MGIKTSKRVQGLIAIEVLAVVTMLVLLVGIALPATAKLRSKSSAFRCYVNHKQLAQAWQLYAHDNNDRAANNFTIPDTERAIVSAQFDTWAPNIMSWSAQSSVQDRSVTNRSWAAKGQLHAYASWDVSVYKCPSDVFLSPAQRARGFQRRVRSISMNILMGRQDNGPTSNTGRSWGFGGAYRQWLKLRDIPKPSMTFLTLDEHPDSINDGLFINDPAAPSWQDIPGSLHDRAATFSFADGHAETHKWQSATSIYPVRYQYPPTRSHDSAGRNDFAWYVARMGLVRF